MGHEAIKLELIEWLTKLEDDETINYLKLVKDAKVKDNDWWYDLNDVQKGGIERGLGDVDEGRNTLNDDIKQKYVL